MNVARQLAALLDRMPLTAGVVMLVGCGEGALAAAYRRRNPACRLLGVERDPALARAASATLDAVACVDIAETPLPFGDEALDCIVYDGVPDGLRDPAPVLRRQAAALRPGGTLVLAADNAEHWRIAERLLRGDPAPAVGGGFGAASLQFLLTQAGLHPVLDRPGPERPGPEDLSEEAEFVAALGPALRRLRIDTEAYRRRAAPRRHLACGQLQAVPQMVVTSTMLAPVGGVSQVRVADPMRAMATDLSVTARIDSHLPPPDGTDGPRLAIFHRPAITSLQGLRPIRAALAAGHLAICEFDDHPGYIPILDRPDVYNFSAMHAVQTSTQALADILRRDNPEVAVFLNAVPELPEIRNFRDPGRLTLFCAGLNREADWLSVAGALNAASAVAGERLHVRVVNDRGLFDALRTPHKSFTPLCDYATYRQLLATSELSCMPLLDTPFNRCKSDLKFIEAASHRVASLASDVVYADSIVDGRTGAIFRTPDELRDRLLALVRDPGAARAMGDAARDHVARHRMLATQVARRTAWYRSLWARRDTLTAALLRRVPELVTPEQATPERVEAKA